MNKYWIIFAIVLLLTGEAIADIYLERRVHATIADNSGFSAEIEKCKEIRQIGEQEFCLGKVLVKYGRLDEAKEHLRTARDTSRANGKPDRASEVETWASANGIPL